MDTQLGGDGLQAPEDLTLADLMDPKAVWSECV